MSNNDTYLLCRKTTIFGFPVVQILGSTSLIYSDMPALDLIQRIETPPVVSDALDDDSVDDEDEETPFRSETGEDDDEEEAA